MKQNKKNETVPFGRNIFFCFKIDSINHRNAAIKTITLEICTSKLLVNDKANEKPRKRYKNEINLKAI